MRKVLFVLLLFISSFVFAQATDVTRGRGKEFGLETIFLNVEKFTFITLSMYNTYKNNNGDQLLEHIEAWAKAGELDQYDVDYYDVYDKYFPGYSSVYDTMILYNKDIAIYVDTSGFKKQSPYIYLVNYNWDKRNNKLSKTTIKYIDRRRIREEFGIGG